MLIRLILVTAATAGLVSAAYHAARVGIAKEQLESAQGGAARARFIGEIIVNLLIGAASCGITIVAVAAI